MLICLPVLFPDSSNRKAPISRLMNPCDNFMTLHFLLRWAFGSSRDVNLNIGTGEVCFERGLYTLYLQKTSVSKGTTTDLICVWFIPVSPLAGPSELSLLPFWIYHSDVTLGVITVPSPPSLSSGSSRIPCQSQFRARFSDLVSEMVGLLILQEGEWLRLNPWAWQHEHPCS